GLSCFQVLCHPSREGQLHAKLGAFSLFAAEEDAPALCVDDALRPAKSESGPAVLGSEIWGKDLGLKFLRNASSRILHGEQRVMVLQGAGQSQLPAARHGLHRIDDQVSKSTPNVGCVDAKWNQALEASLHRKSRHMAPHRPCQFQGLIQKLVGMDKRSLAFAANNAVSDAMNDLYAPHGSVANHPNIRSALGGRRLLL